MRFTPADMLTLSRLVLTPVFLALFVLGLNGWALAVFVVAGVTDMIDGTVARLTGKPSKAGAILDPLADKALVQTCFVALAVLKIVPLWFMLLALARDVMIVCGIYYLTKIKAKLPYRAAIVSKVATFAMLAVAVLGLVMRYDEGAALLGRDVAFWLGYAIILTAILIVVSGIRYIMMGFDILRQHRLGRA